jgi:hypothetical protein
VAVAHVHVNVNAGGDVGHDSIRTGSSSAVRGMRCHPASQC